MHPGQNSSGVAGAPKSEAKVVSDCFHHVSIGRNVSASLLQERPHLVPIIPGPSSGPRITALKGIARVRLQAVAQKIL